MEIKESESVFADEDDNNEAQTSIQKQWGDVDEYLRKEAFDKVFHVEHENDL